MKTTSTLITIVVSLILFSCAQLDPNKQIDEGVVKGEMYTSKEIGWTIEMPNGWEIISKETQEENEKKGLKAIAETQGGDIDASGVKHLISFKKNQFNIFQSTSEPFKEEHAGEWAENNTALKNLLHATYTNQGMKIDTSSTNDKIDGLDFDVFQIVLYSSKGEVILHQDLYWRYINGFDFGVTLNYNNEEDKETLQKVWRNSKFKKE